MSSPKFIFQYRMWASLVAQLVKNTCNAGNLGLIHGLGRFPGGGHGNPLQFLAWRIPMDIGVWWATVQGVTKESDTIEQLNRHTHTQSIIMIF